MKNDTRLHFFLPGKLADDLRQLAADRDRSVSAQARHLLRKGIDRERSQDTKQAT